MSRFQWVIVATCVWLNMLDGFDVMAMAFTAKRVTAYFSITATELGLLISAGLVGMALGSMFLAPLADRLGRRPMLIAGVATTAVGMVLASFASTALLLGAFRILTGLGIGIILACVNVLLSEYSSHKHRGLAIGLYTAGYGIGAGLGGFAAVALMGDDPAGWRVVFLVGGIVTLLSTAVVFFVLPESVDFLVQNRPRNVLAKLNRIADKIKQPRLESEKEIPDPVPVTSSRIGELFKPRFRRSTLLIWAVFFLIMLGFYFVNSWTPALLTQAGMTENQGIIAGLLMSLGGATGAVFYGLIVSRFSSRKVLIGFAILTAGAMVVFILSSSLIFLAMVLAGGVGFLVNGCMAGAYTTAPPRFPALARSTGMGWTIGIGRVGAILAPTMAGALLDAGATPVLLYVGAAGVMLLAALAVILLRDVDKGVDPADTEPAAPEMPNYLDQRQMHGESAS
ncbi:MFS transporter [Granulicoccus sp. GXG6511]|uniref:MFS transporter n=1 Tax=Granulicoccus sp. GXG6511 TaxID=3381351 RepID=UPI003D7CC6A9